MNNIPVLNSAGLSRKKYNLEVMVIKQQPQPNTFPPYVT